MDIAKLKVVELRAELAKRGLDQKGVKAVLVARLQEALENEKGDEEEDEEDEEQKNEEVPLSQVKEEITPSKTAPGGQDDTSVQSIQSSDADITHPEEDSMQFGSYQEESESKMGYEVNEDSVPHPPHSETSSELPGAVETHPPYSEASSDVAGVIDEQSLSKQGFETSNDGSEPFTSHSVTITDVTNVDKPNDSFGNDEDSTEGILQDDSSSKIHFEEQSSDTWNQQDTNQQEEETDQSFQIQDSSLHLDDSNAQDALVTNVKISFEEETKPLVKGFDSQVSNVSDTSVKADDRMEVTENKDIKQETDSEVNFEMDQTIKEETDSQTNFEMDRTTKQETDKDEDSKPKEVETRERKNRWGDFRTESRKRQRSPSIDNKRASPVPKKAENEPDFDEKAVLLSWYDSDLHLIINPENFFSASVLTDYGFGYVWAGARATYGFDKGKVYYEVRITENLKVPYLENELHPNILRVGWSVPMSNLQLGEYPLTYGFGGTGKISTNCQFRDYGKPFVLNDVVGVYLDMGENQIEISYTINGEYQGVAYSINYEELKGQALFPHILTKNCCFEVNFGNREPWAQPLPGFTNVGEVPLQDRVLGPKRPEKKEDCEVIMLIGLPASGKTTWAAKYAEEHKSKMYNILGTNALIDKMKVMGIPRYRNYSGRWESLIASCTKCLNHLLDVAAQRRRNYIIDQTNVYPSAQRRKMRGFEGFLRRAVVIVPTDEELKARAAKREADEGKDVPDSAVLEMKANFALPEKGDVFDEVIYAELQEEEARKLVAQYNKESNDQGFFSNSQQHKRFRMDDGRWSDRRDYRNEGRSDGGDQRRMDNRGRSDNRGGPDGWRDRGFNNRRGGGDNRGWGPPRPGGGWRNNRGGGGNWRGGPPNRFGDRGGHGPRDSRDRSRDYRDRRDGPPGGGKMPDRRGGDRGDDKNRPKSMPLQGHQQSWGNQPQGGYNQGWGQNYGNNAWGNWNQGYNQQQWKGYTQQPQQQAWGQQSWGNQGWGGTGWNQQYYNQYQQNWTQQQTPQGVSGTTDASGTSGTDGTTMAAAYAGYGQTAQAGSWPGYTTMCGTGYASVGSSGNSGSGGGTGGGGSSGGSTSYSMQKQYRQDPRKSS